MLCGKNNDGISALNNISPETLALEKVETIIWRQKAKFEG
jgi:hypothetical protein